MLKLYTGGFFFFLFYCITNIQSKNSIKECQMNYLIAIKNLKRIKYFYKIHSRNCLYNIRIHFIPIIIIILYGTFYIFEYLNIKVVR